jgi:putative transposase
MRLVYNFNINTSNHLTELCKVANNLYNQALYQIKTTLDNEGKFLFYKDLDSLMKNKSNLEGTVNYKLLKAQVAQQTLKVLEQDVKSYIASVKDWSKNPTKYKSKPRLPYFKHKNTLSNLIYTNQACVIKEDGYIYLSKTLKISIPQFNKYKDLISNFNQVRIVPKNNYIKVEIIYNKLIENKDVNYNEHASIDLGVNNLVTLVSSLTKPILLNGNQIKSYNQFFNKELARLTSIKDKQKIKGLTNKITELYVDRENTLNDLYHKISRFIVEYLIDNKIGNLIVGYNKQWKDSIDIGKVNNQKFCYISYLNLLSKIKYKCEMVGIKVSETEESYTSKTDSLSLEKLYKYGEAIPSDFFKGQRVKRGLFQSVKGLINADVNGAVNIMRKVVDDSYVSKIIDRGLLFNPVKIREVFELSYVSTLPNFLLN